MKQKPFARTSIFTSLAGLLVIASASCVAGSAASTPTAQQVLERATAKLAVPDGDMAVALQIQGNRNQPEQAQYPTQPFAKVASQQSLLLVNDGRFSLQTDSHYPGGIEFRFMTVGSRNGSATVDPMHWREGIEILRDSAEGARGDYADFLFLIPTMLLRDAVDHHPIASMKSGKVEITYKDAVARPVTLMLDPVSAQVNEAIVGKDRYVYTNYREQQKLSQPKHMARFKGEQLIAEWDTISARLQSTLPADAFHLPPGYQEKGLRGLLRATDLGHGTWRVDGTTSGYHTGFVVGERSVAVFDAPVSVDEANQVAALIHRTAPGKPIAYVVVSHVHGDHVAGLPAYLKDGAQVLAGTDADIALRRQFGDKTELHLQQVAQPRELDLGKTTVTIYPLASTHASTMLVGYAPQSHTVFQGDLFYLPEVGPIPPAFEGAEELAGLIAREKLVVAHIVGVHGRSGGTKDLAESVRLRQAAPVAQ
ncbi:Metallo-beta-lactamase superfamily protein [Dyella sp. OK004]|uniref:MBL fold metallo-hydrolase n=1 Tax=Dyella sp. OK004 TaxID=1855292 RepID=UPI0008F3E64F|nr:MBL fold metallo-hydrolase [Dyella sp. OK004]SFS13894.1 Metallo-beta-lactamase superfamily protein [Dyella sp. OK004]